MASEVANMNGNYAQTQSQGFDQNLNTHNGTNGDYSSSNPAPNATTNGSAAQSAESIPKDEVGWYFVEQYYTTISRNPDKLYLFYNKRSQYVSGTETEKVNVSIGQKQINDRIKELDFQDCKVRVTNVDSQGSGSNIVIQVIGEISTKSQPQKRFTQTFVLAEQQNGYFVLNDIFRYLLEDDEEEAEPSMEQTQRTAAETGYQEQPSTVTSEMPQGLTSAQDPTAREHDAGVVDKALEKAIEAEPALTQDKAVEPVESTPEVAHAEEAPVAAVAPAADATESAPVAQPEEEVSSIEPEKPTDPEPTPVASPPKPAAAQPAAAATPAAPPKPAAPKTWASMLASNRAPVPAIPSPSSTSSSVAAPKPAQIAPKEAPQAAAPTPASVQVPPTDVPEPSGTPVSTGSEWQTAGADSKKQSRQQQQPVAQKPHADSKKQSRQQQQPVAQKPHADGSQGYIKNVTDAIEGGALRAALSKVVEPKFVDINRQKNCAFIDYNSAADYQTAVAGNPYELNGERLVLEARKFGGPYLPRGPSTGGRGGRAGGAQGNNQTGRGGMQRDGQRGGFGGGRGGARGGARGRGGAPTAA